MKEIISAVMAFIFVICASTFLFGSWYTVDQGERAVVLRYGKMVDVSEAGLHFKTPLIEDTVTISTRSQTRLYQDVLVYSRDQQPASLTISVNYRVPTDQVSSVYENYGDIESLVSRLLDRQVYDESKNVFGRFNAVTAIQERSRLVAEMQKSIQGSVVGPILIESVQLENIDFDDSYENAVAERMKAEVEVQRVWQNAEREKVQADIVVTQAKAQAESQKALAEAEAFAIRAKGQAEAEVIKARGDALRENPNLIDLTAVEKWDGVVPNTMVPGSAIPFLGIK
jgi:regulator of protease activity HflC (stomatin/prohibitin superfamily)